METKNAVIKSEQTPQALIALAIEKGLSIEQLGKLLDLQERWEKKEAEKSFLIAKSGFQGKCPPLTKSKSVGYESKAGGKVGYNYIPLGKIVEHIKESLHEYGLSFRWETKEIDNVITITCVLSHIDGHSEKNSMSGKPDATGGKNEIQQRGSTMTYLQRYSLIGVLGISSADEDVDGQQPSAKGPNIEDLKKSEQAFVTACLLIDDFTDAKEFQGKYKDILANCVKSGLLKKDEKKLVDYINAKNHKLIADAKKAGVSSK